MSFPLGFWDISSWLAITAIILIITSELLKPYYGKTNMCIDNKRLKNATFGVTILFLVTVGIRIITVILGL